MIKAGIYGASGYMGGEALRIINEHPEAEITWATSRSDLPLEYYHPNMYDSGLKLIKPEEATPCDVVFFAVPTGTPMSMAKGLIDRNTRIIDLGSDFRLKDRTDWERLYGKEHECWDIAEKAVYGITELHRDGIKKADVIANPGCFASAAIFGLAPLVKSGLIDVGRIIVDGLSGTAGAGAEPGTPMHHPELTNNLIPYNVVDHRHTYEMEQELGYLAESEVTIHFTPVYVPISRGILAVCHCSPNRNLKREEWLNLFREFYNNEYFIKVFDMPKDPKATWQYLPYPWVSATSGTNFCYIGLDFDERRNHLVVFSVLDSMGKGGAHAGVQNMNLMFGLNEKTGLERYGAHPY